MAGQGNSSKGNPASHRMTNKALKERRAASWARGQKRKAERRAEQKDREALNRVKRAEGQPTPWEIAKAKRAERRKALQGKGSAA